MIGFIGAMGVEIEALRAQMENKSEKTVGGIEFVSGTLFGKEAVTAVCGIGKVFAAMCAEAMIINFNPCCIINTGVAGSLSEKLGILDVAIGESLVQHDMDTSPLGDPIGLLSGINIVNIPADGAVCDKISEAASLLGINAVRGIIASGDQFINSSAKKEFIAETFGAVACEMEGAAIAQVCFVNKTPFCVLRAISDCADGSSNMDYSEFLPRAAANATALSLKFVEIF